MGDQIGEVVEGTLYYIPKVEFKRILDSEIDKNLKTSLFADMCRLNTLYMIARAGSGHIGSSFSSMDILAYLHLQKMNNNDKFFSSKGHDAPGLYSILLALGKLDFNLIHSLRRIDGLPGHPDVNTPGIITNTGSLGMGISKAKGFVFTNRLMKLEQNLFVMTGDGELQEGQIWESLISAKNNNMHEITMIIDHNKLQSDTFLTSVSDLGDLKNKFQSFGWYVTECDGNDIVSLDKAFHELRKSKLPKVIIAHTVKGKGVEVMEHTSLDSDVDMYKFHSGAPSSNIYQQAVTEISNRIDETLDKISHNKILYEKTNANQTKQFDVNTFQRLIPAYGKYLLNHAKINDKILALDADLVLDTGLIPFKEKFPNRFFEFGIAEQDMVSAAGGMALNKFLPIVHSFSCFLTTRPNEQIYNNSSEFTKIIYVGSLSGVIPGGTGHSHQSVRDISTLSAIPKLIAFEPSCEKELELFLDWAINVNKFCSYLRINSLPFQLLYDYNGTCIPDIGTGIEIHSGDDAILFAYGPIMLNNAFTAAKLLKEKNINLKIINLPWLNIIDDQWLAKQIKSFKFIYSIDNHFKIGGQGDRIASSIVNINQEKIMFKKIGLDTIPPCGTNEEVLERVNLDAKSIFETILNDLN